MTMTPYPCDLCTRPSPRCKDGATMWSPSPAQPSPAQLTVEAHGGRQRTARSLDAQQRRLQVQHGGLRGGGHRGLHERPQRARHPAGRRRQGGSERARASGDRQHGDDRSNPQDGRSQDDLRPAERHRSRKSGLLTSARRRRGPAIMTPTRSQTWPAPPRGGRGFRSAPASPSQ